MMTSELLDGIQSLTNLRMMPSVRFPFVQAWTVFGKDRAQIIDTKRD